MRDRSACSSKATFDSLEQAQERLVSLVFEPMRTVNDHDVPISTYQCLACGHLHLTGAPVNLTSESPNYPAKPEGGWTAQVTQAAYERALRLARTELSLRKAGRKEQAIRLGKDRQALKPQQEER